MALETPTKKDGSAGPIELSEAELKKLSGYPRDTEAETTFLERNGLEAGQQAVVRVGESVFPIVTTPEDFGTRIELENASDETRQVLGSIAVEGPSDQSEI